MSAVVLVGGRGSSLAEECRGEFLVGPRRVARRPFSVRHCNMEYDDEARETRQRKFPCQRRRVGSD